MRELSIILALCGAGWAQQPAVMSVPVLGTFFDPSAGALRTLSGVPGASAAAETLASSESDLRAFVNSQRQIAVALTKSNRIAALRWRDGRVTSADLDSALPGINNVAFSTNTASAALTDGLVVQLWSKLDDSPSMEFAVDAAALGGPVGSLAVSSDGDIVAAVLVSGSVVELARSSARLVGNSARAVAFAPGSHDLLTVDADGRLVRNGSDVLAEGLGATTILAATRMKAVGADPDHGRLYIVDLNTRTREVVECSCAPKLLQLLDIEGAVYVGEEGSGGWLLSFGTGTPTLERVQPLAAEVVR